MISDESLVSLLSEIATVALQPRNGFVWIGTPFFHKDYPENTEKIPPSLVQWAALYQREGFSYKLPSTTPFSYFVMLAAS
jgi:hypothetical protein